MRQIRVVLADDHMLVRQGIRALLETVADITVVGEVGNGLDAIHTAKTENADVILMDIKMPGLNGLDALIRIRQELPVVRVILLSMYASEQYFQMALDAGAAGYLLKNADRTELTLALRAVARGETYLTPEVSTYAVKSYLDPKCRRDGPLAGLTSRQREVLQLIAEGHSNKEIATRLRLSIRTVESHRADLMERLDVYDVPTLVLIALRSGLINTPL